MKRSNASESGVLNAHSVKAFGFGLVAPVVAVAGIAARPPRHCRNMQSARFNSCRSILSALCLLGILLILTVSTSAQQYEIRHECLPSPALPYAGLIKGTDGNFYGSTFGNGQNG